MKCLINRYLQIFIDIDYQLFLTRTSNRKLVIVWKANVFSFFTDHLSKKCLGRLTIIIAICLARMFYFINKMPIQVHNTWVGYWYVWKKHLIECHFILRIDLYMYNIIVIRILCERLHRIGTSISHPSISNVPGPA